MKTATLKTSDGSLTPEWTQAHEAQWKPTHAALGSRVFMEYLPPTGVDPVEGWRFEARVLWHGLEFPIGGLVHAGRLVLMQPVVAPLNSVVEMQEGGRRMKRPDDVVITVPVLED
jgi:hypothetical protein